MKKFGKLLICLLLTSSFAFSGCSLVQRNVEKYLNRTVATAGEIEISKQDLISAYNSTGYQYVQYQGYTTEEALKTTIDGLIDGLDPDANGIYTLTKKNTTISAYWITCKDNFKNPNMRKTTNKKGCVVDIDGDEIIISAKIDNGNFETIGTYKSEKGYIVSRIKKKKWKDIQLKFSSTKPFYLRSCTLESFVGSYVKR